MGFAVPLVAGCCKTRVLQVVIVAPPGQVHVFATTIIILINFDYHSSSDRIGPRIVYCACRARVVIFRHFRQCHKPFQLRVIGAPPGCRLGAWVAEPMELIDFQTWGREPYFPYLTFSMHFSTFWAAEPRAQAMSNEECRISVNAAFPSMPVIRQCIISAISVNHNLVQILYKSCTHLVTEP